MGKQGWNLECLRKIVVLVHPNDIRSTDIRIKVLTRKQKSVGTASVPLHSLFDSESVRYNGVVSVQGARGSTVVELDLEMRFYSLQAAGLVEQEAPATGESGPGGSTL